MTEKTNPYQNTVNLPKTEIPMRAGLAQKEPELRKRWEDQGLYQQILDAHKNDPKFVLHDGPPYPNGDIHIGHALNKILKDFVVRSKAMAGYYAPYVPGWDCHGLPIETQLIKELKKTGEEGKKADVLWFREKCKEYALGYVAKQREQFKALGILGEWEKPYLTLDPIYESKIVELFGQLAENGLVYQGRKPIHWCTECQTALAEAEIEYEEHRSPSIYIKFATDPLTPGPFPLGGRGAGVRGCSLLVWTTTPWTLPANVAVAVHPDFNYVLFRSGSEQFIALEDLLENIAEKTGISIDEKLKTFKGKELEGLKLKHPFFDRESPVVLADYVTAEDGTGAVHIAPGHGAEDYHVGMKYKLPIVMPVNDAGLLVSQEQAGEEFYLGQKVWDANKTITKKMEELGTLLKLIMIKHSYPHCWRCHSPVIFRATKQWFIGVDQGSGARGQVSGKTLRESALAAIEGVQWIPDWGQKRITAMVSGRPDWCISRQRSWGVPIPAVHCEDCGEADIRPELIKNIVSIFGQEGAGSWFARPVEDFLPKGFACQKCKGTKFRKDLNIMDVWLESGASHNAVLTTRENLHWPADMYLEGSDQHRGWFQSSLLTAVGQKGLPPFKSVLTHGFIVDDKGEKMSKSKGNVVDPANVIKQSGADILRWWVARTNFRDDVGVSQALIQQAVDSFQKVRNTLRFLHSNLFDFDVATQAVLAEQMGLFDAWILQKFEELRLKVLKAYEDYEFHTVSHAIHAFCAVELSGLYLDFTKDTLYCAAPNSPARRAIQTTMAAMYFSLVKLLAPLLPYTTEDLATFSPKVFKGSVHLERFPLVAVSKIVESTSVDEALDLRFQVNTQIEKLRNAKTIGASLEAKVNLPQTLLPNWSTADLATLLIVSCVERGETSEIEVLRAEGEKCLRCWRRDQLVGDVCPRCQQVLAEITAAS